MTNPVLEFNARVRARVDAQLDALAASIDEVLHWEAILDAQEEVDWQEALDFAAAKAGTPKSESLREQVRAAWPEGARRKRPLWTYFRRLRGR